MLLTIHDNINSQWFKFYKFGYYRLHSRKKFFIQTIIDVHNYSKYVYLDCSELFGLCIMKSIMKSDIKRKFD
jgi:hypothetical protein